MLHALISFSANIEPKLPELGHGHGRTGTGTCSGRGTGAGVVFGVLQDGEASHDDLLDGVARQVPVDKVDGAALLDAAVLGPDAGDGHALLVDQVVVEQDPRRAPLPCQRSPVKGRRRVGEVATLPVLALDADGAVGGVGLDRPRHGAEPDRAQRLVVGGHPEGHVGPSEAEVDLVEQRALVLVQDLGLSASPARVLDIECACLFVLEFQGFVNLWVISWSGVRVLIAESGPSRTLSSLFRLKSPGILVEVFKVLLFLVSVMSTKCRSCEYCFDEWGYLNIPIMPRAAYQGTFCIYLWATRTL